MKHRKRARTDHLMWMCYRRWFRTFVIGPAPTELMNVRVYNNPAEVEKDFGRSWQDKTAEEVLSDMNEMIRRVYEG